MRTIRVSSLRRFPYKRNWSLRKANALTEELMLLQRHHLSRLINQRKHERLSIMITSVAIWQLHRLKNSANERMSREGRIKCCLFLVSLLYLFGRNFVAGRVPTLWNYSFVDICIVTLSHRTIVKKSDTTAILKAWEGPEKNNEGKHVRRLATVANHSGKHADWSLWGRYDGRIPTFSYKS